MTARRVDKADLPCLAAFLSQHFPASLKVHGTVLSVVEGILEQEFWVDVWPNPKALIITPVTKPNDDPMVDFYNYLSDDYTIFALDQSALKTLLESEGIVDWQNSSLLFGGTSEDCFATLVEVAEKHGCQLDTRDFILSNIYYTDADSLRILNLPNGMTVGELSKKHAQIVKNVSKEKLLDKSLPSFEFRIKSLPNVGLFDAKKELKAFEVTQRYGAMTTLYVTPEHRRKGYASFVMSALAQKLLSIGRTPYAYIEQCNEASIRLHEKMGFKKAACGSMAFIRRT